MPSSDPEAAEVPRLFELPTHTNAQSGFAGSTCGSLRLSANWAAEPQLVANGMKPNLNKLGQALPRRIEELPKLLKIERFESLDHEVSMRVGPQFRRGKSGSDSHTFHARALSSLNPHE